MAAGQRSAVGDVGAALSGPRPPPDPWVLLARVREQMCALGMDIGDRPWWACGHLERAEADVLAHAELDRLNRYRRLLVELAPIDVNTWRD